MPSLDVALIEFHDAVVAQVLLTPGSAAIRFAHLAVYEQTAVVAYDVVSFQAELLVRECSMVKFEGTWDSETVVLSAAADGVDLARQAASLLKGLDLRELELEFNSGGVRIQCRHAQLVLGTRGDVVDTWMGPLG
ncbi:MAG: hypothetical protein KF718_33540 [Polyangiaceae bacterium]|nr:hypothetical protein [Polyangiaceae bacterium]